MTSQLLKRIQRILASSCLLSTTGCAAFMGATYSEEYAQSPFPDQTELVDSEDSPPAAEIHEQFLEPLSNPDFVLSDQETRSFTAPLAAQETPEAPNPFAEMELDREAPADQQVNPFAELSSASMEAENPFATTETDVVLASAAIPGSEPGTTSASTFHPAVPRMPTPQNGCPPCEVTVGGAGEVAAYPDEFLFDGGDRAAPVHYYGGTMTGLDTEDTVVEFTDSEGESHVRASNRVAVYAPRFGSVRTVSGPDIGLKVDRAAGAVDVAGPDRLDEFRGIDAAIVSVPASGVESKASASGVETAQPAFLSEKADAATINTKVDQGFMSTVSTGLANLEMTSIRELKLQIVEVATSNIRTGYGQRAASTQAMQTYATFRAQSTVGVEDEGRKGEIHITKSASPMIAQPGDTVTFTIRFQNVGDREVGDVRIIDNLTPRLSYEPGSGQISIPNRKGGSLSVVPNKEGSQMLRFQLDEPLKGGQSGVITFDAVVR